jgi:hypothetical protein
LQNLIEQKLKIKNKESKLCFVGVSLGESGSAETGIAVIDRELNLLRVDKSYNLSELKLSLANIAPPESIIACIGMPRNMMMLNGKWRIESKQTQALKHKNFESAKYTWTQRFSDRGAELCKTFQEEGMEVFRYNCYYTKNTLQINPPYRSRTPAACKYLQMIIENKLNISGIPSNLIPLPALNAIIGSYTAWKMATSEENEGYKQIGIHKHMPVVSAISI